jgi:hypothetical protein
VLALALVVAVVAPAHLKLLVLVALEALLLAVEGEVALVTASHLAQAALVAMASAV